MTDGVGEYQLAPNGSGGTSDLEALIRSIVRDEMERSAQSAAGWYQRGQPSCDPAPRNASSSNDIDRGRLDAEVMCAEDVAAFLGVDRNTVYDYAARGVIPCRRLGKRLLFSRLALVTWLDPCKAAPARKD